MKKTLLFFAFVSLVYVFVSCKKNELTPEEKMNFLTSHIWAADSLLADGVDEGSAGGLLEIFNGDTKFNEDKTGYVGDIVGTWEFSDNESSLVITSDSLLIPVTMTIEELTEQSLKLTTIYPRQTSPLVYADVRMTFIPK